ncbi:MAG: FAD-linked oxidase C-terminal domain-containing protein [candidate division WOR-3 bacterium]|nr:FAD-linked oxidase C-terminal domain-containing protein [candidate division WOR-3 bacterium]
MNVKEIFADILPEERVLTSGEILDDYSTDESFIRHSKAVAVVFPVSTREVSDILSTAYENNIIIIPRGLGTGLSGGAIPIEPSVIVSMEKMNRILEIDTDNLMAVVQPGVITGELQKAVEERGLFYPPDPASLESCSIGGNIAEASGGPRAVKYGTTRDYVRGLQFVTPPGDIMRLGGKIKKDATGYALKDLIVGSEGTLGIVTEITLSLIPLPSHYTDLLVPFDSMDDAARTVSDIVKSRIIPSTIEFMEERALQTAYRMLGSDAKTNQGTAQLLIRADGFDSDSVDRQCERIGEICLNNNAIDVFVADSKQFRDILWSARRSLHDAVVDMSIEMEREDVVVPPAALPELVRRIKKLEEKYGIMIVIFGHAGDGNVHINILKTEENKESFDRNLKDLVKDIMVITLELGGNLSGEHGIGLFKKRFMHMAFTEPALDIMRGIKKVFDPKNLFNPGKILP